MIPINEPFQKIYDSKVALLYSFDGIVRTEGEFVQEYSFAWALELWRSFFNNYGKMVLPYFHKWLDAAFNHALQDEDKDSLQKLYKKIGRVCLSPPRDAWQARMKREALSCYQKHLMPKLLAQVDEKTFQRLVKEVPIKGKGYYLGVPNEFDEYFFQPENYAPILADLVQCCYWADSKCPRCSGQAKYSKQGFFLYHFTPQGKICSLHGWVGTMFDFLGGK